MLAGETQRRRIPESPIALLPREAYVERDWFEREQRELFARNWSYAGIASEIAVRGYVTVNAGVHRLFVVRDDSGKLEAFHNLCRHRGTELLEGSGRLEAARIVCPYHRWTYRLDGSLHALPMKKECFPDLDPASHSLHRGAVGEFKGMIFVHPDPGADFRTWKADLESVAWPHDFEQMAAGPSLTHEMKCNWKVFFENAIDGYHLAYLHDRTLGGPLANRNVWDSHGRHLVWYSTESGTKTCLPAALASQSTGCGDDVPGAESMEYGGVYMLFPHCIVTPSPSSLTVSRLTAAAPGLSYLETRTWTAKGKWQRWLGGQSDSAADYPGYDPATGFLKLEYLEGHPRDSGDFHWEDVWVCEKMQRSLGSPMHRVAALAAGRGAESPIAFFQRIVLDFLEPASASSASGV